MPLGHRSQNLCIALDCLVSGLVCGMSIVDTISTRMLTLPVVSKGHLTTNIHIPVICF